MSIREFLGHCFCDWRFDQLKQKIAKDPLDKVLQIEQLNNDLKNNRRHDEIKTLLKERLG
jgi:formamidopyrimidine-DNA glycosylase